ncbi:AEC family transporter [Kaarinaea lacus]
MLTVILQMAGLIICGIAWRYLKPAGLSHEQTRTVLTSLVYYLLLPAMVLSVLWKADIGANSVLIALTALVGLVAGLLLSMVSCRMCKSQLPQAGAILLAATFPNATYLGLPVLEATFGPWARSVAIQYDLFACTPFLFTVGILVASRYGDASAVKTSMLGRLMQIPALWAAMVAVILNMANVPLHSGLDGFLKLLERGVVPLMLFSIGLSLHWNKTQWQLMPTVVPVILLRFLIIPVVVLYFSSAIGLSGDLRAAVVIEAAMPTMVLGIVLCDRFKLDVSLYATAVTVTTALSIITLPLWFYMLNS